MTSVGLGDPGTAGRSGSLEQRLTILGLRSNGVITHTNRTVMLSLNRRGVLRVHRGYASAPDRVLKAIVRFLNPRMSRARRRAAEREFLSFPVEAYAPSEPAPSRTERARPGDVALLHRLGALHHRLNVQHFGGKLGEIPIRLSARMRRRLGELAVDLRSGRPLEIGLSRRHLARHPWAEIEHTMLHEMVHQWQAETGGSVNHGASFRQKAREVGVLPVSKRTIGGWGPATTGRGVTGRQGQGGILVASNTDSGSSPLIQDDLQNEPTYPDCPATEPGPKFRRQGRIG